MKYFTFSEFERSMVAALKGYDNELTRGATHNIKYLVDSVLDPLREYLGQPIIITSGYRCADLNRDVGGSPTSAHLLGLAADFHPLNEEGQVKVIDWFKAIKEGMSEMATVTFDQLIIYPSFFHVGIRPSGCTNRRQILHYNAYGQGYRKD